VTHDRDQNRQTGGNQTDVIQTIAEILEGTDIGVLSDHEFDVSYLEKYPHSRQLLECCWQAVRELADEPYRGRVSHAKVMGRAMELLRSIHGVNAPRGWVPVMRTLRTAGSNPLNQSTQGATRNPGCPPIPAAEVLTNWRSVFTVERVNQDGALQKLAEQQPELNTLLLALAERLGVPGSYVEGLLFVHVAIETLGSEAPSVLLTARDWLREKVKGIWDAGSPDWRERGLRLAASTGASPPEIEAAFRGL
jgi:hypothetical protein